MQTTTGWVASDTERLEAMAGSSDALERFERQSAWPMLVLSVAIIPLLVIPLTVDLSPGTESALFAIDWLVWAVFAVEYGVRLYLAPDKAHFVKRNVIDLVVVVVPFLRPLRIARSTRMLRLLRAGRVGAFLLRGMAAVRDVLTRHKLHYTLLVVLVATVGAGLIVAELEHGVAGSRIASPADGLWWAVTTVTTVGYGDTYPVTAAGRAMAVVLMLVGVGFFGLLAASLASFLIGRGHQEEATPEEVGLADIAARLERIEIRLDGLTGIRQDDGGPE
jgi:voltage-gated potassium channel